MFSCSFIGQARIHERKSVIIVDPSSPKNFCRIISSEISKKSLNKSAKAGYNGLLTQREIKKTMESLIFYFDTTS